MALSITAQNPIVVTGTTSNSQTVYANQIDIEAVYWYKPTTVGHLLSVKDSKGNRIALLYCEISNESIRLPIGWVYDGITIDDMDSGTVFIYRRK